MFLLLLLACGEPCPTEPLSASAWCGDDGAACPALADLSRGCIGSHTAQDCVVGGTTYTVTGGDDAAR